MSRLQSIGQNNKYSEGLEMYIIARDGRGGGEFDNFSILNVMQENIPSKDVNIPYFLFFI